MYVLLVIIVLLVLFAAFVAAQPSEFRITRTADMQAPASVVFDQVNTLPRWEAWSPWVRLDPAAKNRYEGPSAGPGAVLRWEGRKVGTGSMTITDSRADEFVRFRLEFLKPFRAVNTAEFIFRPEGDHTAVTWSMSGKNHFIGKAMGLVVNCEKMVGGQFEQGLATLKSLVESPAGK